MSQLDVPVLSVQTALAAASDSKDSLDGIDLALGQYESGTVGFVRATNAYYRYDSASAAAPDGVTVVQPLSGPGRWIRILSGAAGASNWKEPVADYAALPLVGNDIGDVRLTLDTFTIYTWNGFTWAPTNVVDMRRGAVAFDDFLSSITTGLLGWSTTTSGSGSTVVSDSTYVDGNHFGIKRLSTGTTVTGRASYYLDLNQFAFPTGALGAEILVRIPTLSIPAEPFAVTLGFGDSTGAGESTDGFYFLYDPEGLFGTASPNWLAVTSAGTVRTKTDTGVPVGTGWTHLRLIAYGVATGAANVVFTVDSNPPTVNITNLPAAGQLTGPLLKIQKAGLGAASRSIYVDYVYGVSVFIPER